MPMVVLKKRPTLFICLPEQEPENNLTEYLAAKGFGMRRIRDSGHAVDEIVTRVPDLVLLDSHLAPAGGFEVCRAVRSFYRGPILLLGDDRDEAPQLLAFACGSSWGGAGGGRRATGGLSGGPAGRSDHGPIRTALVSGPALWPRGLPR